MTVLAERFRFIRDFANAEVALALGRPDEALALWEPIARHAATDNATLNLRLRAINRCAQVCERLHRLAEAEAWVRRSLELDPAQPDMVAAYVRLRRAQCAWPVHAPVGSVTREQLLAPIPGPDMLVFTDDPAQHLAVAQSVLKKFGSLPSPLYAESGRTRSGRIRIGYLSGDLHMQAVGLLTAELFELHDRSRFEIHAFCWSPEDHSMLRRRLRAGFDKFWSIGRLSDAAAAQLIAEQGIDVLVDLRGDRAGGRPAILTMRPAPVQVSYLGVPGTCGIPGVDWIVADRYVMPLERLPYSTEQPIHLPGCYQVSDRKREIGATPTRAQCGLPEDAFVFCSFNNNAKFTEEVFRCWMRVLRAVPKSVLWLAANTPQAKENLRLAAEAQGLPRERLVFAPLMAPRDYLARLPLADLFLDTFPFNGGTTANDALWMGLPLLTLSGRSFASRMAGSLLTHVGLPDLITTSLADYERKAELLGHMPDRVAAYRRHLAEHGRQSVLFDTPATVRALEAEFERLALEHRAVKPQTS